MPSVESALSAFISARAPVRDARTSSQSADLATDKDFSKVLDETAPRDDAPADRPQSRRPDTRSRRDAAAANPAPRRPADSANAPVGPDGAADDPVTAADQMGQTEPAIEMAAAPNPPADDAPATDSDTPATDGNTPVTDGLSAGADAAAAIDPTIVPVAPPLVPVAPTPVAAASFDVQAAGDGSLEIASLSPAATAAAAADAKAAPPTTGGPTETDAATDASAASVPQAEVASPAPDPTAKPAAQPSKGKSGPATPQPTQGEAPTEAKAQSDAVSPTTSQRDASPAQQVKTSATGPADDRSTVAPQTTAATTSHTNAHTGFEALQPLPANPQSAALASASASPTQQATATVPLSGIAVEIATRVQAGNNRFEIRLDPPELGRIDVRLDVDRHGNVTSHLVVERSETLDLLRRDAPNLERALQDAGLKTGDSALQFSLRDQNSRGDRDARDTHLPDPSDIAAPTNEAEPIVQAARSYRWSGATSGIDIRV